jgi:hypothetical protein
MSLNQALNHSFIKKPMNEMGLHSGRMEMRFLSNASAKIQESLSLECDAQKILEQVRNDQDTSPPNFKMTNIIEV